MKRPERSVIFLSIIAILAGIVLASCGGGGAQGNSENGEQGSQGERGENGDDGNKESEEIATGVPVRVSVIALGEISTGILATAVVEAEQTVDIYPRVTGIVTALAKEEGDTVGKDKTLCQLEDEELKLAESKAKSVMEKAQRDLDRIKLQVERKVLAENDLIDAQYNFDQARIDWEQKKTSLEYTNVVSTIDAIVSERLVRLGQKVDPAVKLYTLFDPKSLVVNIHIPESDYFNHVASQSSKTTAVITTDSMPDMEFTGKIKRIAPVVDPETNTIKITISYTDPSRILRPGMYVRVKLVTDTHHDTVLIPKSAILYEENLMYVFVVRGENAKRVMLSPGYTDTKYVESLEGIEPGDRVVVVGQTGLKDGTKVRVVAEGSGEGA